MNSWRRLLGLLGISLSMITGLLILVRRESPALLITYETVAQEPHYTNVVIIWEEGTQPPVKYQEAGYVYASPPASPGEAGLRYQRLMVSSHLKMILYPSHAATNGGVLLSRGLPGNELCIASAHSELQCLNEPIPQNMTKNTTGTASRSNHEEWIAFTRQTYQGFALYRIKPEGQNLETLFFNATIHINTHTWSPDGRTLLFTTEQRRIAGMDHGAAETREITLIYAEPGTPSQAAEWLLWSPDMTRMFFLRDQQLFVVTTDGSEIQKILEQVSMLIGATEDALYVQTSEGRIQGIRFDTTRQEQITAIQPYGSLALSPSLVIAFRAIPLLILGMFGGVLLAHSAREKQPPQPHKWRRIRLPDLRHQIMADNRSAGRHQSPAEASSESRHAQ